MGILFVLTTVIYLYISDILICKKILETKKLPDNSDSLIGFIDQDNSFFSQLLDHFLHY